MWGDRCGKRTGADKSQWSEPVSATCEAIKKWSEERWPDTKKKAEEERATIIWVNEAGFYLLPMAVRTWAPRGQTPLLRVKLMRDPMIAR